MLTLTVTPLPANAAPDANPKNARATRAAKTRFDKADMTTSNTLRHMPAFSPRMVNKWQIRAVMPAFAAPPPRAEVPDVLAGPLGAAAIRSEKSKTNQRIGAYPPVPARTSDFAAGRYAF
ncbi:MAG: hypothetical protein KKH72_13775 [Alphaproteobacteria bacterium]|nr:hypothetical protein [Alphaproteobacteria bacterium]